MRKQAIIALILSLVLASMPVLSVQAGEYNAAGKLGRGIANFFTGWVEIPAEIGRQIEKRGDIAAIFVGPVLGLCKAVGRTAVGLYDAVTFPIPAPSGYRPVIEPEFVMQEEK